MALPTPAWNLASGLTPHFPLPANGTSQRSGHAPPDTIPTAVARALSPYALDPDSARVARLLEAFGPAGPRSDDGRLAAARLWRRAGRRERALGALAGIGRSSPLAPVADLERARVELTLGEGDASPGERGGRIDRGVAAFLSACEHMNGEVKRELWLDLRGLATPEEQDAWAEMPAEPGSCARVRRFLAERAWRLAMSLEDRLVLHYERLRRARDLYRIPRPRFTLDLADLVGRPDSLELDDRGLVYLRMGEPAGRAANPAGGGADPSEAWAYYRPDGYRLYHFAPVARIGTQAVADYRMQENLGPEARPGTAFFQRFVTRAADGRVLQRDVFPHVAFGRDLVTRSLDAAERSMRRRQEQLLTTDYARFAIQRVADAPEGEPRLGLATEVLRFRDGPGRDLAWVLASGRAGDFEPERTRSGFRYVLEGALGFLAGDDPLTRTTRRTVETARALAPDDALTLRLPLHLPPGTYPFTLVARDGSAAASRSAPASWVQDTLRLPEAQPDLPELSDIAVAPDSGGSWTRDGRTFLAVSPIHVPGPDRIAHIWFEAYGLAPGSPYRVEVRLVTEARAGRMYELSPADVAVRLRFGAELPPGVGAVAAHHLRLDLTDTAPGRYWLGVRVTDPATGASSLPATTTVLVPDGK
ncbi:MAG: hypothetical protein ACE5HF_02935 [Gemmatimonadota bacterium]